MPDPIEVPHRSGADVAQGLVKATIVGVPFVGGTAAELFTLILPTSLERRRDAFFHDVDRRLRELEDSGVDLSHLAEDEGFITLVTEATKAAMGTHLEAKVEMLAACIQTVAMPGDRDDFMSMRLLLFVEELEPEHFIVLTYLADPRGWYDRHGIADPQLFSGSPGHLMDGAGLGIDAQALPIVLHDLDVRGLARLDSLRSTMSGGGAWQPLITDLGRLLLDFVQIMATG